MLSYLAFPASKVHQIVYKKHYIVELPLSEDMSLFARKNSFFGSEIEFWLYLNNSILQLRRAKASLKQ